MTEPKLRQAVRGLIIDPADRVLLMHQRFAGRTFWALPGGGIEPGEDHPTALRRELTEEVGIPQAFVGPLIFRRTFLGGAVAGYDGQQNHVYLVPSHAFEPQPTMTEEELEAEGVMGWRWWTVAELDETDEALRPAAIPEVTKRVLEHGAPAEPWTLDGPEGYLER